MATHTQRIVAPSSHWKITILITLVAALVFLWPYMAVLSLAAVSAYLFYPIHARISRKLPAIVAAAVTVAAALLIIILPVMLMLVVAVAQGVSLASTLSQYMHSTTSGSLQDDMQYIIEQVNHVVEPLSAGQLHLSLKSVRDFFANTMPTLLRAVLDFAVGLASSVPALFAAATIYIFMFMAFLTNGARIVKNLRSISPFGERMTNLYFERSGAMIKASVVSQLLISFVLALLTALLLLTLGAGPYFFFLVGLLTILNMIPLGSAPLVYVISILAIMSGNISGGLWVFAIYQFVICNVDNFMRPRLIPKNVRLSVALTVLSIFCGLYYFGIMGLIYGPLVMILLLTTYDMYLEYRITSRPKLADMSHA